MLTRDNKIIYLKFAIITYRIIFTCYHLLILNKQTSLYNKARFIYHASVIAYLIFFEYMIKTNTSNMTLLMIGICYIAIDIVGTAISFLLGGIYYKTLKLVDMIDLIIELIYNLPLLIDYVNDFSV